MYAGGMPLSTFGGAKRKFPLDGLNFIAAWSTRKLVRTYKGGLYQLCAAQNATNFTDVMPLFSGNLNELSVTQFLKAANSQNGYAAQWYDQSGKGLHMVQADTNNYPLVVNNGVFSRINNRPAIFSQNANVRLTAPAPFSNDNEICMCAVLVNNNTQGYQGQGSTGFCMHEDPNRISAHTPWLDGKFIFDTGSTVYRLQTFTAVGFLNQPFQSTLINSISKNYKAIRINGAIKAQASAKPSRPVTSMTVFGRLPLGQVDGAFNGAFAEVVLFDKSITDAQLQAFEHNQAMYFGIKAA